MKRVRETSAKDRIKSNYQDIYHIVKPYIDTIPDLRPINTLMKMKEGIELLSQNNWDLIEREILALDRIGDEAKEEEILFLALYEDNIEKISPMLEQRDLLERFALLYPGLIHILNQRYSVSMNAFLLRIEWIDLIKEMNQSFLHWIPTMEIGKKIKSKFNIPFSFNDFIRSIHERSEGRIIWGLLSLSSLDIDNKKTLEAAIGCKNPNKIIPLLLKDSRIDPNTLEINPLYESSVKGFLDHFLLFLKDGRCALSHDCLEIALKNCHFNILEPIVKRVSPEPAIMTSLITKAIIYNAINVVKSVLERGRVNYYIENIYMNTAIRFDRCDIFDYLLSRSYHWDPGLAHQPTTKVFLAGRWT